MGFNTPEISNDDGQPILLYEVQLGETYYRYCTADEDLTLDGKTWEAKIWVTVYAYHLGDPDEETPVQWVGTLVNSKPEGYATVRLTCRSLAGSYDRDGLRLAWERTCPHPLYGPGCWLDKDDFAYPHEVATMDTATRFSVVTYADPAEGTFAGGFMEWTRDDGTLERRAISAQNGNDFEVLGTLYGLEVGDSITLYPGCDRTTTTCILFGNLANNGGFPHLPGKSPFDGTPVF
jgi:uncharacterized phage protein (TIGR02218 family)